MADLQLCYFCGRGPDDAIGEYAVVPPALDPSPAQQQSVALCPDCRDKLMAVMDPVVDAAESFVQGDGRSTAGSSGGTPADRDAGRPTSEDDGTHNEASTTSPGDGDGGETTGASRADAAAGREGPGEPPDEDASDEADADGVTSDPPGAAGSEDTVEPEDIMARNEGDAAEEPPSDSAAPRDQPHTDDELVGRNNEAYNKTLRLLQNREFPVERHEIEQVAANAYQLDPQEVSDAIDALIRKGLLTQEGAQLLRS